MTRPADVASASQSVRPGRLFADRVAANAAGALAAQRFIFALKSGEADPLHAPDRLHEVRLAHSARPEALNAFLIELAKAAAR